MTSASKRQAATLLGALVLCLGIGGLGGLFTSQSVTTWYPTLTKPPWNPPSWVFGPVWTTLYILMAFALWLAWRAGADRQAIGLFMVQLLLKLGWSALFFGLRRPELALVEIIVLLVAIVWTAVAFRRHSRLAALLLVPYMPWVAYATSLNAATVWLNP